MEVHDPVVAHGNGSSVARPLDFSREVRSLDFQMELSQFLQMENSDVIFLNHHVSQTEHVCQWILASRPQGAVSGAHQFWG